MIDQAQLEGLQRSFAGARAMSEGGREYVFIPNLKILIASKTYNVDGLLSLSEASPYPTRLFLSEQIPKPGLNWHHSIRVVDRTWYTWSWRDVTADANLIEILAAHLSAFK